jgi:hypothetical protein
MAFHADSEPDAQIERLFVGEPQLFSELVEPDLGGQVGIVPLKSMKVKRLLAAEVQALYRRAFGGCLAHGHSLGQTICQSAPR